MKTEFCQEAFKGYNIPERIKSTAINICDRFVICGICDPVYICNVIAKESGSGDGQGKFNSNVINNIEVIAKKIQWAYGCNIIKEEIPEIEYCLINGSFVNEKATEGLRSYSKRIKEELKTCDEWRKDYLNRQLNEISESILLYVA